MSFMSFEDSIAFKAMIYGMTVPLPKISRKWDP